VGVIVAYTNTSSIS